eukprot:TRINITY_DN33337_c0_g1_i2.p1 TRINITY_DN33337_c0_g1~~TRINITY_DN33337_c0_g1_i2.p1  ORF type:complete len:129 (+),score=20.63 TRINITY_DN33337_c0_g1_i2:86-472(+)
MEPEVDTADEQETSSLCVQPDVGEIGVSRSQLRPFSIHDAAASGDTELLKRLLWPDKDEKQKSSKSKQEIGAKKDYFAEINDESDEDDEDFDPVKEELETDLHKRDMDECTPLQLAILNQQLECVQCN